MNRLDKSISLNTKMITNEIGIACVTILAMALAAINLIMLLLWIVLGAIAVVVMVKAYKKLYYTSLYGNEAYMYNAIPLSVKEVAAGKIFAASLMLLACNLAMLATCAIVIAMRSGMISFAVDIYWAGERDVAWLLLGQADPELLPLALPIEALKLITGSILTSTIIFFGVVYANSQTGQCRSRGRKTMINLVTVVICLVISAVLNSGLSVVVELIGMDYSPIQPLIQTVINCAGVAALFTLSARIMEKKYFA